MSGYDVIGDIHGYADKLTGLLRKLGYSERQGAWRHPERTAVFVGDLIDRGPFQRESVAIPRAMVEAGSAQIVLGNHEFNAIAYQLWSEERGDFCRSRVGARGTKHLEQHRAFVEQIGLDNSEAADILGWFRTIPLWLDLGELRVIHACWDQQSIDHLAEIAGPNNTVSDRIIVEGTQPGHATYDAIETLIKGPEIDLRGRVYLDKGGHERRQARRRWWDESVSTLRDAALIPGGTLGTDGQPFPELPEIPLTEAERRGFGGGVPVIVGHYWESGTPEVLGPLAACVDYSAGKGGPLVAYQWSEGQTELTDSGFALFAGQLFVFASAWHEGYHIVSRASVERAQAIHDEVEAMSSYDTYGELRRAGELEELGDRLSDNYGVDLESYVAAIEDAAGLTGDGGPVPDRLGGLEAFDFDGAEIDGTEFPADDEEFRPQGELDNEVDADNVFMHEIAQRTRGDLPSDLWEKFGQTLSPTFSESVIELIPPEQLAPLTSALESRGYLIEHG